MSNPKTYEQYLAENGSLTYTFKGVSMKPMLTRGRDLFTVSNRRYQLYCHVWVWLHPLRITVKKAEGKLKRLAKRILRNEA